MEARGSPSTRDREVVRLVRPPLFLGEAWQKLVKIVDLPEKLGKAIAYAIYDGRAYFYKSAKTVASWT
jgi:hypothetical protein